MVVAPLLPNTQQNYRWEAEREGAVSAQRNGVHIWDVAGTVADGCYLNV